MASRNIEFRVGLFILTGIIILAGSLYWLQGYRLQNDRQIANVMFDDVGMLKIGNIVTVSGVFKGKVSEMMLVERGVLVKIMLAGEVILKKDAQFVIRNYGLMGERFVAVYPGNDDELLQPSDTARGKYDSGMPEVMGLMGEMVTELHELVLSFKKTVGSDSTLEKFNRTVANLESVSSSLSDYLKDNEKKMDESADNFLHASRQLSQLMTRNTPKVDSSLARIDKMTVDLEEFVLRLDSLSYSAREFADRLNNPDGTLQLLLEDHRLYDDLRKAADNIDDLITDIKTNPRKYLNLKFELF